METSAPEARGSYWGLLPFAILALAQGIIPYTHTLQFAPGLVVERRPSSMAVWRDVLDAAGIGLLVCSAAYLAFSACYMSLCRAYGDEEQGPQAHRTLLRRAWLYPLLGYLGLPSMLVLFVAPEAAAGAIPFLMLGAMVVPLFVFISTMKRGAEAMGISSGWAWLVVLVPLVLAYAVEATLIGFPPGGGLLESWLPPMVDQGS